VGDYDRQARGREAAAGCHYWWIAV
jgi:hypothetical protein